MNFIRILFAKMIGGEIDRSEKGSRECKQLKERSTSLNAIHLVAKAWADLMYQVRA